MYKLVFIKPEFIAETVARTGSEEIMHKSNRSYVGIYDEAMGWYIPLRAKIGKFKPEIGCFLTPFKTTNPHFVNPGLDFEKALYVPKNYVEEIRNLLPHEQAEFIDKHLSEIKAKFEDYVLLVEKLPRGSPKYLYSTVPLFPEGIVRIKEEKQKRIKKSKRKKRSREMER